MSVVVADTELEIEVDTGATVTVIITSGHV